MDICTRYIAFLGRVLVIGGTLTHALARMIFMIGSTGDRALSTGDTISFHFDVYALAVILRVQ